MKIRTIITLIAVSLINLNDIVAQNISLTGIRKVKDIIVYKDSLFYSAFPSVVKRPDGELLVAFRRAPDRRLFGQQGISHTDPNSYLVVVRSRDGET